MLATRFTERYGCKHPFAGAGMGWVCETPDLAAAVCAAGGVGPLTGLPVVYPPERLRETIRELRRRTDSPFHVNLLSVFPNVEQVEVCAEERVPIASFHWGHPPAALLARLQEAGVSAWEQVGSAEAARRAVADGVDAVIAQGAEAGGHNNGELPTFVQVPDIVDAVSGEALVLAAGGIADGRQVAAALCLGADAVWVGTALIASPEANVHPEHKRRLVAAASTDAVLTSIFGPEMPDFNPMRVLRNRVVTEYEGRLDEVPTDRDELEEIGRTVWLGEEIVARKFQAFVPVPETTGDFEEMAWLAGQGAGLVREVRPAAVIVEAMMADAEAALSRLAR
jgi:NAD(P)H-dependent flavin oxidoreductase YrpB (nitropropane dioxygenase family)